MYRFVLSRRWLGFALFVILLAGLCIRLGFWQLHRLENRLADNKVISANLKHEPVGIDTIARSSPSDPSDDEWKRVRIVGTYDTAGQVLLKYQTRDEGQGVDVVTPLVTSSGRAVLVDRGWLRVQASTQPHPDVPKPPTGTVTVTGWWRVDNGATGGAIKPQDGQVRAISSRGIATSLDYPVDRGYVNLLSQSPKAGSQLEPEPRPEMGQGPHFFYAMQWYFFAALALFGWFYFAWSEAHPKSERTRPRKQSSDRPQRAPVDRQHDAGDVRSRG